MFVLRKITSLGVQMNLALGDSYTLVLKQENPEEFRKTVTNVFKNDWDDEAGVYGFVTSHSGKEVHCLYPAQKNYIMTESGRTFAKL